MAMAVRGRVLEVAIHTTVDQPAGPAHANATGGEFAAALRAERRLSPDEVWAAAEARLDRPVSEGLNGAHEACDRWARDRARLGLIVRDGDGNSERWTYAELSRASRRLARVFHDLGLRPGDRVAALLTRQVEAYLCALAAWRAGLIYMPLFVGFGSDALAQRMGPGSPAVVVVDHAYRAGLDDGLAQLGVDPAVICVAGPGGRGMRRGDLSFWSEVDVRDADFDTVPTQAADPATLLFTSGTTGAPKGCVLAHSMIVNIQPYARHAFALRPDDLFFTGADPGWAYGLYTTGLCVMALGSPIVISSAPFDPDGWLRLIEAEQVTYTAAAPSAYRRLVTSARKAGLPGCLRGAACAGEPLDAPTASQWWSLAGVPEHSSEGLQDGYGLTEMGMVLGNFAFEERPVLPGSLSSVVPGFEAALVDDDGRVVEEQGIIAVRRPRFEATIGYWNAPDLWTDRWRDGWYLTGDLARRDEDGRWWFVGRSDDLIISAGYNISPVEIENVIQAHPGVAEAAVVGAPDPARGQVVRAVVVPSGTTPNDQIATDIQEDVRRRIGRHAVPKIVDFVDALPRTETGKLRRNVLRVTS